MNAYDERVNIEMCPPGSEVKIKSMKDAHCGKLGVVVGVKSRGKYLIKFSDGLFVISSRHIEIIKLASFEIEEIKRGNIRKEIAQAYREAKEKDPGFKRFARLGQEALEQPRRVLNAKKKESA